MRLPQPAARLAFITADARAASVSPGSETRIDLIAELWELPRFDQVEYGLDRTVRSLTRRERPAVMKAKRAAGCGNLIDATSCVVRDRDRDIDSAHCVAPRGFGP